MSGINVDQLDSRSLPNFETEVIVPRVHDEWEKMYLDIDKDPQVHVDLRVENGPQVDDEWERMYLDTGDNELRQDISSYVSDQRNDDDGSEYGSMEDESCSLFDMFGLQNCLEETNESVNRVAYIENLDSQEGEVEGRDQVNVQQLEDLVQQTSDRERMQDLPLQPEYEVFGRRIVDIGYLFKQIQVAGEHSEDCHFEDMTLKHEIKSGLSSTFIFKCDKCGTPTRIETDQKKRTALGVNRDAVLGITCVGLGFSHIEEVCANLDVPSMSYSLFREKEKFMQEDWFKLAKQESLKALLEEIEIAKAKGQVDSKGNALIRIITDGSWGKRSYGRFFSSLSGCAVIIGLHTKKVIYFDTRNKYCHICKLAEHNQVSVKEHKCNKNYSGPSSAMESDIIIQGFKECDVLGARFNVLISDGDSNTYKMIRDLRIYKNPDVHVAKLECVNHLHRNFNKKFNNLSTATKFNSEARNKFITDKMFRDIRTGVCMATKHWRESNETPSVKKRMLEKDILNVPAHYIGCHEQCNSYFCKKKTEPQAVENMKLLKDDGLFYEIQSLCQSTFGNNAKSLLAGFNNNPAEQLNSYVAKYLGGKQINYSLAGSYTSRVAVGVAHFNSGCHASSAYRKSKFGGVSDVAAVDKLENKRKRKCEQNAVAKAKKPRVRPAADGKKGTGYGGDYSEDMEPKALEAAKDIILDKLTRNQVNQTSIETMTRDNEHLYHENIRNVLMSYYFSTIVNSKGPKFYSKILNEMMYTQSQLGNNARNKHQRLQQIEAELTFKRLYSKSFIEECGLFIDEELCFLGASPFRLVDEDFILSIKCPLNAYKKSVSKAKLQFWKTTKGQRTLNTKSQWYIELQGELHVTKRKFAYLMIWLGETQFEIVIVKRDDGFFRNEMREKLAYFFKEVMLPELANSRKERKIPLRQYEEATKTFV